MRNRISGMLILLTFTSGLVPARATDYWFIYLGGQSNMDGYGYLHELPDSLNTEFEDVWIFHANPAPDGVSEDGKGMWTTLRPGHGVGFASDGHANSYSDRFGPELSLAARLKAHFPEANLAFFKYSRGGASLDCRAAGTFGCWDPDFGGSEAVNQYDHFLSALRRATSVGDIDGDGTADRLIPVGILWMQGESDASFSSEIAFLYERNLDRLIGLIRAALRIDDLPAVIGRISDSGMDDDGLVWNHVGIVRAAQDEFVRKDGASSLAVSTDDFAYSDPWHYDGPGYVNLGIRFADALVTLMGQHPGNTK